MCFKILFFVMQVIFVQQIFSQSLPFGMNMACQNMPFPYRNPGFTRRNTPTLNSMAFGMPLTNIPFDHRTNCNGMPNVYNRNMQDLYTANAFASNFGLNPAQMLSLNKLLGNIPFSNLGYIDEQTHLPGYAFPSVMTVLRSNPNMQSSVNVGNTCGMPWNMPLTGISGTSNFFDRRNTLPYF